MTSCLRKQKGLLYLEVQTDKGRRALEDSVWKDPGLVSLTVRQSCYKILSKLLASFISLHSRTHSLFNNSDSYLPLNTSTSGISIKHHWPCSCASNSANSGLFEEDLQTYSSLRKLGPLVPINGCLGGKDWIQFTTSFTKKTRRQNGIHNEIKKQCFYQNKKQESSVISSRNHNQQTHPTF